MENNNKERFDFVPYIEKYMKMDGKHISLYPFQKNFLRETNTIFRLYNKSRQIGMTRIVAIEALCYAMRFANETIMIVSVSLQNAKNAMNYIQDAYNSIDVKYRLSTTAWNQREIVFDNGSRIISIPNNPKTAVGLRATRIYLDEYSRNQFDEEIWKSIFPSITRGGRVTIFSTPMGKSGKFFEFCDDAKKGKEYWSYHEIPFSEIPELKASESILRSGCGDEETFLREYCCQFVDETESFFSFELIQNSEDSSLENDFQPSGRLPFYIGVDFGKKIDSTAIIGVTCDENGYYREKFIIEFKPPTTYREVCDFLIRNIPQWRPTKVLVDGTGVGEGVVEMLRPLGSLVYPVIFTNAVKSAMISKVKILMQDGKLKLIKHIGQFNQLHSLKKTVNESGNISYKHPENGRIQHDDFVWALALAVSEIEYEKRNGVYAKVGKRIFRSMYGD